MTDAGPLLVPIRLDAAVSVRLSSASGTIRRWTMKYSNAASLGAIEPPPFSGPVDTSAAAKDGSFPNQGVYLMWTLPAALRHGVQKDQTSGAITFPPVPNRWLVVRSAVPKSGAPTTVAWIVESDFLGAAGKATSPYLKDKPTNIGRKIPLTGQAWAESNRVKTTLTAVAPGNPAFAAFQPDNEDVFSIHDKQAELPSSATLHYFVAGWHAHPDDDPLAADNQAAAKGYAPLLESLRWVAPDATTKSTTSTIYHGLLLGVQWDVKGVPPKSSLAEPQVALGATAADALTAFLKAHAVDGSSAELLEAFAVDLLDVLEQPGGTAIFRRRLHDARFASADGGIRWEIVDSQPKLGEQPPPVTADELDAERKLLTDLNAAQADLDSKRRRLASLQRTLYELWWKNRKAQLDMSIRGNMPFGTRKRDFDTALDPTSPKSLAGQVKALRDQLLKPSELPAPTADVPGPTPEKYASENELPANRQLVPGLAPRFFTPQDPVLLISGLGHDLEIDPQATLACRYADDVLTAAGTTPKPPAIAANGLPPIDPLLAEFVLLQGVYTPDQKKFEAAVAAKASHATSPDLSHALWRQPWLPLYLEWQVAWEDINYVDGKGAVQWTFNGRDFVFTGKPPASGSPDRAPTGRTLLTPGLAYTVGARLDALADGHPESDALMKLRDTVKGWDFLSQTLDGLTLRLAKRDPSSAPAADGLIGELVAGRHPPAPVPEQRDAPHGDDKPTSSFEGLRAGQFALTRVAIVDRFGQVVEVSDDLLAAAPGLTPQHPAPGACAELPPRLFQGARLRFTAVDEKTGKDVLAGGNPLCGFLVPDHVGRALAAHDAAGKRLGELRLVTTADGASVVWDPEPLHLYAKLTDLSRDHPQLGAVLRQVKGAGALNNFLTAIDETLWTIDPLSGDQDDYLTALAGRPLALVRARLAFELDADPMRDPDWPFTFKPVDPPFLHYDFPVKLGAPADREDGLVGYFVGAAASPFHALHMPARRDRLADKTQFVKAAVAQDIKLRFDGATSADVTLLVDPRARVYARTGVLPATPLELPAAYLKPALAAISTAYRAGPLLAYAPGAPLMPTPTASGRTWSWIEQGHDGPTASVPFPAADDRARFSPVPATAREGFVQVDPTPPEEVTP